MVDGLGSKDEGYDRAHRLTLPDHIGGRVVRIARNYIIFSEAKSETFILAEPPIVATAEEGGRIEVGWIT